MLSEAYTLFSEAFTILQQVCLYTVLLYLLMFQCPISFASYQYCLLYNCRLLVQCTGRLPTVVGNHLLFDGNLDGIMQCDSICRTDTAGFSVWYLSDWLIRLTSPICGWQKFSFSMTFLLFLSHLPLFYTNNNDNKEKWSVGFHGCVSCLFWWLHLLVYLFLLELPVMFVLLRSSQNMKHLSIILSPQKLI